MLLRIEVLNADAGSAEVATGRNAGDAQVLKADSQLRHALALAVLDDRGARRKAGGLYDCSADRTGKLRRGLCPQGTAVPAQPVGEHLAYGGDDLDALG